MIPAQYLLLKQRVIRFYGQDGYIQILRVAEQFMTDNKIQIPSDGVESMPSFWKTVEQFYLEDSQ